MFKLYAMTKFILPFVFVLSILSNLSLSAQKKNVDINKIMNDVSAKAQTFNNLKYDFSYRMVDKAHDIDNDIKGSIVMQGDMYNLHIMGRNVVSDGKTQWSNDPDAEEIQITDASESANAFSFLKIITSVNKDYTPKYIKTDKKNGKYIYVVDMTPKTGKSYYKVRLMIDKDESFINEAIIYEKDGVEYYFTVEKFATNLNLSKGYFKIDPANYPDFEVVDLR